MTAQKAQTVHVLFATVTGNAEEIARRIHSSLTANNFLAGTVCAVQDYKKTGLGSPEGSRNTYIIVASTTGDGDAPDTARPFMKFLRTKNPTLLQDVPYAVLALGDTNYENFCATGKRIDKAMKKLGAIPFYDRGDADDGTGLEEVVEPWIEGLWDALRAVLDFMADEKAPVQSTETVEKAAPVENTETMDKVVQEALREVTDEELGFEDSALPRLLEPRIFLKAASSQGSEPASTSSFYDESSGKLANVSGARKLTADAALKDVWHVEVTMAADLENEYRPGDAFGLLVENDDSEVDRLLKHIPEAESEYYELMNSSDSLLTRGSVRRLLKERVDFRSVPKKTLLRALSKHCTEREERVRLLQLCSKKGRLEYRRQISQANMSTLAVLETIAPSCKPPLSLLLDQLPPLAPRWYSAASAAAKDGAGVLHFAFSVVENGLATSKLAKLCSRYIDGERGDSAVLIPRSSDLDSHFHPPQLDVPYIMIGPGTGVAPFRGFLREREAMGNKSAPTMLFFGCRKPELDYLYREELETLEEKNVLDELDVAFSRISDTKVYVQNRMLERANEVADIIRSGGFVFVCGDGGGMAKGVDEALHTIVAEQFCEGGPAEAALFVKNLAAEHRYVRDVS